MVYQSEQIVERLFRTEYGKLLATLTKLFGPSHLQLAEDVVRETLISALSNWSTGEIPANPTGWLVQVAKRKALNKIKRNHMMLRHHHIHVLSHNSVEDIDAFFLDDEIKDSQLRMIFTCCHPALDTKSQIALTLKTLCGFGIKELAKALLSTESTINKRLYRAKEKIRKTQTPFTIPQGSELIEKLDTVGLSLYLLFNEGYNATGGESVIKKELCLEAIRLAKLLVDRFKDDHKLNALLALMCFHTARFDARIDDKGTIILFEDQDRSLWNRDLIHIGMGYLKKSLHDTVISAYHVEARIAAEHCLSASFEQTDWQVIHDHYLLLGKLKPNPIIQLNLAIIQSKLQGVEKSLSLLDNMAKNDSLKEYHLLPVTQGIFHMKLQHYQKAKVFLEKSLAMGPSNKEIAFIQDKIRECENMLPKS